MRIHQVLAAIAVLFAAAPAFADTITPQDWKTFREESTAHYIDEPDNFEWHLYKAAEATKTKDAAIAEFARRLHADPAAAADYAEVIVDMVVYASSSSCGSGGDCGFRPGTGLYGKVSRVAMAEPTGRLMFTLSQHMDGRDDVEFTRLIWKHPASSSIFLDSYNYGEYTGNLAAGLLRLPQDPSAVKVPRLAGDAYSGAPDETSGLVPAVVDATEARLADAPGTVAWRAWLAQFALREQLALGLNQAAVRRYLAYPEDVRALLPLAFADAASDQYCRQVDATVTFGGRLAAALWLEGRTAEARTVLARAFAMKDKPKAAQKWPLLDAMADAFTPAVADKDLFRTYVEGPQPLDAKASDSGCWTETKAWLFAARGETPAIQEVLAARLARAGHKDMADWWSGRRHSTIPPVMISSKPLTTLPTRFRSTSASARSPGRRPSRRRTPA